MGVDPTKHSQFDIKQSNSRDPATSYVLALVSKRNQSLAMAQDQSETRSCAFSQDQCERDDRVVTLVTRPAFPCSVNGITCATSSADTPPTIGSSSHMFSEYSRALGLREIATPHPFVHRNVSRIGTGTMSVSGISSHWASLLLMRLLQAFVCMSSRACIGKPQYHRVLRSVCHRTPSRQMIYFVRPLTEPSSFQTPHCATSTTIRVFLCNCRRQPSAFVPKASGRRHAVKAVQNDQKVIECLNIVSCYSFVCGGSVHSVRCCLLCNLDRVGESPPSIENALSPRHSSYRSQNASGCDPGARDALHWNRVVRTTR